MLTKNLVGCDQMPEKRNLKYSIHVHEPPSLFHIF